MTEGISKSEFAKLVGVTAGRITQYISAGKIHGDALIGRGRKARINPTAAALQLKKNLDADHRLRTDKKAQLDLVTFAAAEATAITADRSDGDIEHQIQAERLEGFRRDNRRKAEEEAARSGRYVGAADASKWFGKLVAMLVNLVEAWLGELSSKLSAKFGLNQRDVMHFLRSEFKIFRASASTAARRQAEQLPILIDDDPAGDHAVAAAGDDETPLSAAQANLDQHEGNANVD
jgi:hypothetical protein